MGYAVVHVDQIDWRRPPDLEAPALEVKPLLGGQSSPEFRHFKGRIAPGGSLPFVSHEQATVLFGLEGSAQLELGDQSGAFGAGDFVYVQAGLPYRLTALDEAPFVYACTHGVEHSGPDVASAVHAADAARQMPVDRKIWVARDEAEVWTLDELLPPDARNSGEGVGGIRFTAGESGLDMLAGIGFLTPRTHYSRHFHDQPEIYHVLRGEGSVLFDDGEVEISPGSVLYIAGREVHGVDNWSHEPIEIYYIYGCETHPELNWTPTEDVSSALADD